MLLNAIIYLPVATGLLVLVLPASRPDLVRGVALGGAVATLALAVVLWIGFDPTNSALQWRTIATWIPGIGANYDIAVDGVSLALMTLTALLLAVVMAYVLPEHDRARAHAFLFLLLGTGLMGVFAARDLLLFYFFFEIGLVPMYFIIGMWGGPNRRYAALKFFLYTRAGSLAMLLGFLGLYLSMSPHTFSLPAIIAARPLANSPEAGALVFFALLIGFGVKLPTVPVHNWLPDAHVEAPTEGSVVLAGLQLKMGAYGLVAILLPVLPDEVRRFGWLLVALALASMLQGALAALAQSDMKRLVAYTSVNHMGYVTLAVAAAGLSSDAAARALALDGAVVQMVSHGLLTGGLFLMVGMLQHRAGTRELGQFGAITARLPVFGFLFTALAFGSLGLPGLSGFIAEFQVIGGSLSVGVWVAAIVVLGLVLVTAVYLRLVSGALLGQAGDATRALAPVSVRELGLAGVLLAVSVLIGVIPGPLVRLISGATRLFVSS